MKKRSIVIVFAVALVLVLAIAGSASAGFAHGQAPDVTALSASGVWDSSLGQYRYDITWTWSTSAGKPNWCYFYVWNGSTYVPEWGYSKYPSKAANQGEATATYYSATYYPQWRVYMSNKTGTDWIDFSDN